jgi:toxin YoeB
MLKRVNLLVKDIKRNPYDKNGIGKPENLKENFSGYFSRRVTAEHRLVYKVLDDMIIIAQCRYHY